MPSENERLTIQGLIERFLNPDPSVKDSASRQQARLTIVASLILAGISFISAVTGSVIGFPGGITAGLYGLVVLFAIGMWLGHTENHLIGSIFLVSSIILAGFILSAVFPQDTNVIIILMTTIVPAFSLGLVLLPLLALIIIAVIVLITIGVLPLMATISATTELLTFVGLVVVQGIFIMIAWFKERSEILQQDEVGILRGRLEERVEDRIRYSKIAAEISQELIKTTSLEGLYNQAVTMINARLGFSLTCFYQADEIAHALILKSTAGIESDRLLRSGKRVEYNADSLLSWVVANKQLRLFTRLANDPLQLAADLLPGNQSEVGVPIMAGGRLLGVLDIQSTRTTAFDNEILVVLQMLTSQISTAIENVHIFEAEKGSIQEVTELYLAGYNLAQSKSDRDVYQVLQQLFPRLPYVTMLLIPDGSVLKAVATSGNPSAGAQDLPESISVSIEELSSYLGKDAFIGEGPRLNSLPYNLVRFLQALQIFSTAVYPIHRGENLIAIFLVGTRQKEPLNAASLQPYASLARQVEVSLAQVAETRIANQRIEEIDSVNSQLDTVTVLAEKISAANSLEEVFTAAQHIFEQTRNGAILLIAENGKFRVATSVDPTQGGPIDGLPELLDLTSAEMLAQMPDKTLIADVSKLSSIHYAQYHPELTKFIENDTARLPLLPPVLLKLIEQSLFQSVALIPVIRDGRLETFFIVGTRSEQVIPPEIAQVYTHAANLVATAVERIRTTEKTERRIREIETVTRIGQEISAIREVDLVYRTLHAKVRDLMGDVNFLVAIYNSETNSISVPYMFEKGFEGGDITSIESFPVGEGLTSILLRTKKPLLLVEDTEKRTAELGAKIAGKPAQSWLGSPLIVSGEAIGALVVQDVEKEHAFDETDEEMLTNLSNQVAGAIYNARLLDLMKARAIELQTAAEVARDISGSLDLGELLDKAVKLIYERFNFYHAAVFMVDQSNEFAVIREATGEAGIQMKRSGHKLQIGSKSIVGYVTSTGEPLTVNDTSRDATYFANPLLPETRAEVAIPLRVGQRILGALDVQSTRAFAFAEEDVRILRILADQMAIAVINSELFADTQEHLSQHRLLHHVTTAAASGTTLEESLNSATQGLQVTMGGDRVSILLADKLRKVLKVCSFAGYSEEVGKLEVPYGKGITGWVAEHQQSLRISDVSQDSRYIQAGSNIGSELAIPLSYRGDLLGVLNVESDQVEAYNEADEELLGTLGGSLAAIISNARLIEQVKRQVDHERMLYEVTSKIRRSTDMQTIMATTATELSKVLGARRAQIKLELESQPAKNSEPAPE